uniref:Uncharacterized protein n=1 Tax=Anguilla anguilla TaxID=7936 RepID=A0A0E9W5J5_ANGAN
MYNPYCMCSGYILTRRTTPLKRRQKVACQENAAPTKVIGY